MYSCVIVAAVLLEQKCSDYIKQAILLQTKMKYCIQYV